MSPAPDTTHDTWDVYVIDGKRKPRHAGTVSRKGRYPATFTDQGTTYYFASADMVEGTVTYINVPLGWTG